MVARPRVGTWVRGCFNAAMVPLMSVLLGLLLGILLVRGKGWQRARSAARGEVIRVSCLARRPARGRRWARGRMVIGPDTVRWEPGTRRGLQALPDEVRQVDTRSPSWREALWMNGRARIIECTSAEGVVQLAVLPHELDHVLAALERVRPEPLSE